MGLREQTYDIDASIFGNPEDRAVLGLVSAYSGVVALINPNGEEHYIYPTAAGLSAGNKTLMNSGTEGTNLVPGPVPTGPIANTRAAGLNILGNHKVSGLVTVGGRGIRGAIGFLTGASPAPRLLYFTNAHVPQLGSIANWQAGTGGTALGAALAGPFSKHDETRDATTNFTGPVIIAGREDKPSGLGFIVGEGLTATMVWTVNGTALVAGSPATFYAL